MLSDSEDDEDYSGGEEEEDDPEQKQDKKPNVSKVSNSDLCIYLSYLFIYQF